MFGIPPVAALAISSTVARAVDRRLRGPDPQAAGLARLEAQLEAIRDRLSQRPPDARDVGQVEEILAHACARIEEWS
jgi:hypothetical protein